MTEMTPEDTESCRKFILKLLKQHIPEDSPARHLWLDAEQQCWVFVLEALESYNPDAGQAFTTWAYQNVGWRLPVWIDGELKHEGTDRHLPDWEETSYDDLIEQNQVDDFIDFDAEQDMQDKAEVFELAQALSEREQGVLDLLYYQGLNHREAGDVLGVSRAMVRKIEARALKKMRARGAISE